MVFIDDWRRLNCPTDALNALHGHSLTDTGKNY